MAPTAQARDRRTSVDVVFDELYESISGMELLPGDKISEAEIATKFGVSRQPVRDAFNRLENLDLLLIRPQRATEVKRFSSRTIAKSRFVRAAVECEVLRRAARLCGEEGEALLEASLALQKIAIKAPTNDKFGELDYQFHETICGIAQVDYAFEVIKEEKAKVDRLCMLSLAKTDRRDQLLLDHKEIAKQIIANNEEGAVAAGLVHLSRLDATIETIQEKNPDYFED
ncbi:GntR family transcriptional regulator [Alphaproteobacteria bacterium KMM 3653]|uniref:GntR family transcriptional regulator n=1 Tax=Harenicola maris TaxID=2841044 RepID=A0AAP2CQ40_9RHOB|nr:GntR family transcriptional regulator [Harenicola maris]